MSKKEKEFISIKTKKFTVIMEQAENGASLITRVNNGFSIPELIGLLRLISSELQQIWKSNVNVKYSELKTEENGSNEVN